MSAEVDRLHEVAQAIAFHKTQLAALNPERDQLVRALHARGLSLREIAAVAEVSHVTVRDIVLSTPAGQEPRLPSAACRFYRVGWCHHHHTAGGHTNGPGPDPRPGRHGRPARAGQRDRRRRLLGRPGRPVSTPLEVSMSWHGKRARVHFNLHQGGFSVRCPPSGPVSGTVDVVILRDAVFHAGPAAERIAAGQPRQVCAWVTGTVAVAGDVRRRIVQPGWRRVTFNPKRGITVFTLEDDGTQVEHADRVLLAEGAAWLPPIRKG